MWEMGPNDPNCPPILGKLLYTSSLVFEIDFVLMESLRVGESELQPSMSAHI